MLNLLLEYRKQMTSPYKSKQCIDKVRVEKLKKIIQYAKNYVTIYREKYAGISVNDIKHVEDIQLLPILKSKELKEREIKDITSEHADLKNCILLSTSGTSGVPFKLYINRQEYALRQLTFLTFLSQHGWKPWWKSASLLAEAKIDKETILQKLINRRRFYVPVELSFTEQVDMIFKINPQFIIAIPPSVQALADYVIKNKIKLGKFKLIVLGGAILTDEISSRLKKAFGHPGIDYYGTVETSFLGGDCPKCELKYLYDPGNIVEILDEEDNKVRSGEAGRAIITSFDHYTTPIIRYDIGDNITIAPSEHQCKIRYSHYKSIDGRVADILKLKNGKVLHIAHVNRVLANFKQVQFYQKTDGYIIIKYVARSQQGNQSLLSELLRSLGLQEYSDLSFEQCDFIPLEANGKYKIVKKES